MRAVVGFAAVPWQQSLPENRLPVVTQLYYAMGPPQVSFPPSEFSLPLIFYAGVVVFAFYFQFLMCHILTNEVQPFRFAPCNHLEHTHGRYVCLLVLVCSPYGSLPSSSAL